MSDFLSFLPATLSGMFYIKDVHVHDYEGDIIITVPGDGGRRLMHLYENAVDDKVMYGISIGREVSLTSNALFIGDVSSVEVSYMKDDLNWDFNSLTLIGRDGKSYKIYRGVRTFPEPVLSGEMIRAI